MAIDFQPYTVLYKKFANEKYQQQEWSSPDKEFKPFVCIVVPPPRIEPGSSDFQSVAMTTSAKEANGAPNKN